MPGCPRSTIMPARSGPACPASRSRSRPATSGSRRAPDPCSARPGGSGSWRSATRPSPRPRTRRRPPSCARRCTGSRPGEAADPDRVRARLPIAEVLGPATLAYAGEPDLRAVPGPRTERLPAVPELIAEVPPEEAGESGLDEITSDAFAVREDGRILAAAGYTRWPRDTAHLSVLTAPGARGRGLARAVAAAAARDAFEHGLVAQWRARPAASRRVAAALGFRELGSQLSVRLAAAGPPRTSRRAGPGPRR